MSIGPGFADFWDSGVTGPETFVSDAQAEGQNPRKPQNPRTINATYADNAWDTAYLAGKQLPGLCKIANGLTEIGIDMKKPDGKDGATITVKGYKPGKFDVSCTMWTAAQWDVYREIHSLVWRKPQKGSKLSQVAINISHPALQVAGIFSCVIEGITFPQPGEFEGSKVVVFKCIENVPPGKPATKTAKASSPPLIKKYRPGEEPVNATPAKESTKKKNLSPKGPPAPASNGTS